ncbi:alkaline phosphatase family protein [Sphingobacterium sp. HJSM2_6]|uniref:alkaline phosphatase family protein n=1 Tax=Sphingobacterium sp. HJSM2_6 TaxID=3366264 RepID=UPI003BD041D0
MNRIAVIDIVGLSSSVIGKHTPNIQQYINRFGLKKIKPILPAVTTSAQTTYLTGTLPSTHGIVGNGWFDYEESEIKFWKQSNKLVQAENIWDTAKKIDPQFTCAQMFWWYNMYNNADYSVTPRPNYLADGRKMPDCYAYPSTLRDELTEKFGKFPLFSFWGPNANIVSSEWIANAALYVEDNYKPTLNLIYLPHLDYCLQKFVSEEEKVIPELQKIDQLVQSMIDHFEKNNVEVILLSEYGIAPVNQPIHINRILRQANLLDIRIERGLELLDAAASAAFAVSDHQIAHIYCKNEAIKQQVKTLLANQSGIAQILDDAGQKTYGIDHERSGDLVLLAERNAWFTYYFWEDDAKAPDYARMVDIHKKPGYDPVEMFMTSKSRAIFKLLLKKIGLRAVLDITPLDASLVQGSHGLPSCEEQYFPVWIGANENSSETIDPTQVKQLILDKIFKN